MLRFQPRVFAFWQTLNSSNGVVVLVRACWIGEIVVELQLIFLPTFGGWYLHRDIALVSHSGTKVEVWVCVLTLSQHSVTVCITS